MTRLRPTVCALVLVAACHRAPADPAVDVALRLVETARSPAGIDPALVDDALVEQARRLQLVHRYAMDTLDAAKLDAALAGDAGPDRRIAPDARARAQRERAAHGLRATLDGACTARRDPEGLTARVQVLTAPIAGAPTEVTDALASLGRALDGAALVRVTCAKGAVGVLEVPRDGRWRVVDLVAIGPHTIEMHPDDPSLR